MEYAKKLEEIGVIQESMFFWRNIKIVCPRFQEFNIVTENWFSAFTASELSNLVKGLPFDLSITDSGLWCMYFCPDLSTDILYTFEGENLAELMAKMILANHKKRR